MIKKINIQTAIKRCLLTFAIMASTVVALAEEGPTYVAQIHKDAVLYVEGDEIPEGNKVGDVKPAETKGYATLKAAIDDANGASDKTIELLADVTLDANIDIPEGWTMSVASDKTITIDLNGFDIKGNVKVANDRELTIVDNNTENKTPGTVSTLTNNGTLTLSKGFITTLTAGGGSSVTTGEDGTITTLSVAVTEGANTTISGTGYSQISGNGTVKLGNELNNISILTGSSITLDLNGCTITSTSTNAAITNAGTLSFADSRTGDEVEKVTIPTITNNNGGTLTIDNCNVTTLANNSGTVTIANGNTLETLNNDSGTITANGTITTFNNAGNTTIFGTGITAISGAGTIVLGDDRNELTLTATSGNSMTLNLNGHNAGKINASGKVLVSGTNTDTNVITEFKASESAEITVESGTITTLDASANGTKVNIKGGTVGTLTTGDNTEVKFTNITTEEGLNTAIALTKKSVIELATDITLTNACAITSEKNITIDLKGYNITYNITTQKINNEGKLFINDSGKKETPESEVTYGTVSEIANKGTLTVNNNATITTLATTDGTATINGGTVTRLTVSDNATATINSGSTIGTLTANNDKVQINGGSINTIAGEGTIDFPAVNSADLLSLALKAKNAKVTLNGPISGNEENDFKLADGANITINVNGQTVTNTGGNTFEIPAGSLLSLTGSGKIENATDGMVAVNNAGTFTLSGPEVASATLNGTQQTIKGGTLDAATLSADKTIDVNGGTVTKLTTTSGNTVKTTSGTVNHLANAAGATTTISGNGFKEFSGSGTITLNSDISSNLTVNGSGTDLTINIGEYSISNHEQANTVNVASGAQLTITGTTGSITNSNAAYTAVSNAGTTNINGGTIASATSTAGGTLNINSGATVTTLKAGAGETIINGGTVTNLNGEGTIKLGADIENVCTVTGGNVTLDLSNHNLNTETGDAQKTVTVNESATLNVIATTAGTIGKIDNKGTTNVSSNATVTELESTGAVEFTGGAITTLTVKDGTANITASGVGTLNANGGTVTIDTDGHKPTTMNIGSGATVNINGTSYDFGNITTAAELTQALAMTKSGTLKLGADGITGDFTVPTGSDITIDLSGHNITGSNESSTALTVAGTLKVLGSGTATVSSVATSENTGNFTLEGANVTTLSNAGATTLTSGTVGTITASTGTLEIKDATVGDVTATGTTTITAGTITTLNTSAGTTNISGGTVTTLNGTGTSDITISKGNITTASAGKKMTVSGGSIGTLSTTSTNDADEGLTIENGEITTLNVIASSKANVSGGTIGTIDVYDDATLNVAKAAHVTTYTGAGGPNVKLPSYSITDTNAGSYPIKFVATKASYTRESGIDESNRWGTVCLPFDITNVISGIKFYKVTTLETDKLNLEEYEVSTTKIVAGTPVVFHIEGSTGVDKLIIASENANVNHAPTTKEQAETDIKLVGTFEQKIIEGQTTLANIYYISDNAFHQAKAKLTVPIYRAYLMVTSSNGAKPRMIYINEEEDATGIQSMLADGAEIAGYYDLNGVCHETPQKGMNIVKMKNGKSIKLMIK